MTKSSDKTSAAKAKSAKAKSGDAKSGDSVSADERAARKAVRQAERTAHQAAERARREAEREARRAKRKAARDATGTDAKAAEKTVEPVVKAKAAPTKTVAKPKAAVPKPAAKTAKAAAKPSSKPRGKGHVQLPSQKFNILVIAQAGRLEAEAALLAASLRRNAPDFSGRLIIAEPRAEDAWAGHKTLLSDAGRAALSAFDAEIIPFTARVFGASYPQGNKIEGLSVLPAGEPFLFLDTDTLITGPIDRQAFDFARPSASMRREGTWPQPPLYGPNYQDIWRALYDRFGVPFDDTLDLSQPEEHWERFMYFNAGWFFGADPVAFHDHYLRFAREVWQEPGDVLATQKLEPWLDQAILPVVIRALNGGRPPAALASLDDGSALWHYRTLPLLYAMAPDSVVDVLETAAAEPALAPLMAEWEQSRRMVLDGEGGSRARPMFDRTQLPLREQSVRHRLRGAGLWIA